MWNDSIVIFVSFLWHHWQKCLNICFENWLPLLWASESEARSVSLVSQLPRDHPTLFLLCLLPLNVPFTLSRDKLSIADISIVFMSDLVTQHRLYLLHPLGASNARLLVACCATLRNFLTLVLKMPGSCRCLHDPTKHLTTSHVTFEKQWWLFGRTISHHDQKVIVCFYPRQKDRDSC